MRAHRWLIALALCLLPEAAFAQATLACNGPVATGTLYDTTAVCGNLNGLQTIFSGLVCNFQTLLGAILSSVYCGMQFSLLQPLKAALVLFVMVYGIQLAMGYAQASGRDIITRLVKISLVWVFATNAAWGIGMTYTFFTSAANSAIGWVFNVLPLPDATPGACTIATANLATNASAPAFSYLDYVICTTITGPFTDQGAMVAGFFAVMAAMIPPIFLMFMYFTIKSLKICARCLLAYLLAMAAIAFLITLSPIFLSLALFKPTQHFFNDWLKFLISFTLQIVFIFAGFALWVVSILQLSGFFSNLATMVRQVQLTPEVGQLRLPTNTWGLCHYQLQQTFWGPYLQCDDQPDPVNIGQYIPRAIMPSQFSEHPDFIYFLVLNLLAVCTVVYVFDTLMGMLPGLAKSLAGHPWTPQIGGGGAGRVDFGSMLNTHSTSLVDRLRQGTGTRQNAQR